MDLISPNLKLPYLAPAQAQKHVTHNEALRQLDAIVQLSVSGIMDTLPADPENGQRVIFSTNPQEGFTDKPNYLAAFQDGAWAFYPPQQGWRAFVEDSSALHIFDGANWIMPSEGSESPSTLGVNSNADTTNRLVVKSPATLFDNEGAGHQLKVNKSDSSATASLLLQTGYSARAELGLTGDDNFHLKTSTNGSDFKDSLIADAQTGAISFPHGANIGQIVTTVEDSGGADYHYGLPNLSTTYQGRSNLNLARNRVYFSPFYVDRPTQISGGFIAQYGASSTIGSIIRAGLFKLGTANGNHWDIGERVVDFGTQPADTAGYKDFETTQPSLLDTGWYVTAVGTNGAGVSVRYLRSLQPGQSFLVKNNAGATIDIRFSGAANYLFKSNAMAEIENGYSTAWPSNPVSDSLSVYSYGYLPFIPKWKHWDA